ncbi:MAG: hypothetical protein HC853_08540 [Anaerolineae bacterium]|nr:hypothetical protein [Anaerolineae bacterium]
MKERKVAVQADPDEQITQERVVSTTATFTGGPNNAAGYYTFTNLISSVVVYVDESDTACASCASEPSAGRADETD